jgi:hypothetical protein
MVHFKKNVVGTKKDGSTYKSEELVWDINKKQYTQTKRWY